MPRSRRRKIGKTPRRPDSITRVTASGIHDAARRARADKGSTFDEAVALAGGYPLEDRGKEGHCSTCGRTLDSDVFAPLVASGIHVEAGQCPECRVTQARQEFIGRYFDALLYGRRGTFSRTLWGDPIESSDTGAVWASKPLGTGARVHVIESVVLYRTRDERAEWRDLVTLREEGTEFGPVWILRYLTGNIHARKPTLDQALAEAFQHYEAAGFQVWHHVSVTVNAQRVPSYEEMAFVKEQFIGAEREAYSVWAPKDRHVSIHDYCLHLWHCLSLAAGPKGEVLPNFAVVGPGGLGI